MQFHAALRLLSDSPCYCLLGFSVLTYIYYSVSLHLLFFPYVSVCPSVYIYFFPTHAEIYTHTHTSVSLGIFSVISSNTTLSSRLITKQGHNISLHELATLCGWVCEAFGHTHTYTHTHTQTHLSMPPGPYAQLSLSLIRFPSSILNPHSSPSSRSSLFFSLTSHTILIFSYPRLLPSFQFFLLLLMTYTAPNYRCDGFSETI